MSEAEDCSTKNYTIYQFSDPTTSEIRYVGLTNQPPEDRWRQHETSSQNAGLLDWLSALSLENQEPIFEVIDGCDSSKDARLLESCHMIRALLEGNRLLNQQMNGVPEILCNRAGKPRSYRPDHKERSEKLKREKDHLLDRIRLLELRLRDFEDFDETKKALEASPQKQTDIHRSIVRMLEENIEKLKGQKQILNNENAMLREKLEKLSADFLLPKQEWDLKQEFERVMAALEKLRSTITKVNYSLPVNYDPDPQMDEVWLEQVSSDRLVRVK